MKLPIRVVCLCILLCSVFPASAQKFKNVMREVKKGGGNIGRVIEKGINSAQNATGDAIHDIGKLTGKAAEDAKKVIENGFKDATRIAGKAGKSIEAETRRVGNNSMDVGTAVAHYVKNYGEGTKDSWTASARSLKEGKIIDALYRLSLDPLTVQEEAAFIASQESKWLNMAGATAASVYGGPGGAAAYASWQTYRITDGNAELALRAGVIVGITNVGLNGVAGVKTTTSFEMARKAVFAGAVGGVAIAAAGGSEADINKAFIRAGGLIFIQDLYQGYTGALDPVGGNENPETISKAYSFDEKGNLQLNIPEQGSAGGQSPLIQKLGKVPGFQALGIFHDKWVISWGMSDAGSKAAIFPAIIITAITNINPADNDGVVDNITKQAGGNTGAEEAKSGVGTSTAGQTGVTKHPIRMGGMSTMLDTMTKYTIGNGETVFVIEGKVIGMDAKEITDPAILATLQKHVPPPLPPFDSSIVIPNGFKGNYTTYRSLPPLELAVTYKEKDAPMNELYLVRHATASQGSTVYIRNLANGRAIRAYVQAKVSYADSVAGITVQLTEAAFNGLAPEGSAVWVETEYEDITINSYTVIRGDQSLAGRLVFNNLWYGKWELWIFDNVKTLYKNKDYKNDYPITLPPGEYGFELTNVNIGQVTERPYHGVFTVQ